MKAIAVLCALYLLTPLPAQQRDYPVKPVPFTAVHINDGFWAPRIETNRTVTIPFAFGKDEETGRMDNFIRAAQALRGEPFENKKYPPYPFDDTDVYKVIEGASYTLSVHPDPKLDAYIDGLIEKIGAAQEKDGYLYTARTINPLQPHPWSGQERWVLEGVNSHELYDLGHLYEAAAAHYAATGKRGLLDIALRTANMLCDTFGPGKREIWPGHQIVEMGLVKLYRVTGDVRYLNLAKFMLDVRGPRSAEQGAGNPYVQAQMKVVDQTEAVTGGHAVRAVYMYSGMADVGALTGDMAYINALDKIWENVAGKKLHITGGIGARAAGESFGADYELPNMSAYNETCAAVGNDFWNHRLFLLHADARYIDVMERTLYNGLISGVSLDGKTFFYENPLEATGAAGKDQRSPWFGVACCPGNITRFMASVPGYVYAERNDAIWVNLYVANTADIKLDNGRSVHMTQETRYPWDGAVKMTVAPDETAALTIHVRIPGWARNEPVPSDLYRMAGRNTEPVVLKVNGKAVPAALDKGYVNLTRTWKKGDTIELIMPMPVRRVLANDHVAADRGRVAVQRGPIVYAAEWVDNPDGKVRNLMLPDNAGLTAEYRPALLNGVEVVTGKAVALAYDAQGRVVKHGQDFTMIPYYAWANRGRGQMTVWMPNIEAAARPLPYPTMVTTANVAASGRPQQHNVDAIKDGEIPSASNDHASYFDWYPARGNKETVDYTFAQPAKVGECGLYWFDDAGQGGVRVPASWRLLYKDGDQWRPVETQEQFGVAKDKFNSVKFTPVTTTALRVELQAQPNFAIGMQKWTVK
ncbi:MAG TPA: glycoside hydrolase family 127 protein [Candidatus Solibacter sp.]|nr:glycoside hydrolase family 127 protein [Candidatus Solibacter sp.]